MSQGYIGYDLQNAGEFILVFQHLAQRFKLARHVKRREIAPVQVRAHERAQLGEGVLIMAHLARHGRLAELSRGGDAAVAADDAVFALGRGGGDDDVLKEAVLFHALDGGEELLVLRHGEAVHGVILEVGNAQLADKLAVDGAGGLGGLLQRPEDGRRFLARHAQPSIRSSISSHSAA